MTGEGLPTCPSASQGTRPGSSAALVIVAEIPLPQPADLNDKQYVNITLIAKGYYTIKSLKIRLDRYNQQNFTQSQNAEITPLYWLSYVEQADSPGCRKK